MRTLHTLILSTLAAAALSACGGGSDAPAPSSAFVAGGSVSSANVADTPSSATAPTATITATQATADALKAEATTAFETSKSTAFSTKMLTIVGSVLASDSGRGVERVQEIVPDTCTTGTLDSEKSVAKISDGSEKPAVNTDYNFTFSKCVKSDVELDGKMSLNFSRYVDEDNLAYILLFKGITVINKTDGTNTVNGGIKCDLASGAQSCAISDGTRGWDLGLTYANGVLNGSYATKYADGIVTVKFVDYSASSGTATITGKAPTKTVLTRTSATALKIDITGADGVTKTF